MTDQTPPGKGTMAARQHLVQRLVDRHDLDPDEAYAAVARVELGVTDGPHAQLVAAEARAAIDEALNAIRNRMTEAMRPLIAAVRTMADAFQHAMATTREDFALAPPPAARQLSAPAPDARPRRTARRTPDRPAWQSPYGPARRH